MTREEAQSVIMTEQKCVDRAGTDRCNRDCANCDLVMDDAVINEAYNMAIKALEQSEAAIDEIKEIYEWHDNVTKERIIEHLGRLPSAQPEQRWIPCSERLPEEDGGLYLVTDYAKSINRRRMHLSRCYMNKDGFWSDVPIGYKVVAWQPLPEPYREEGEQE